ncbi:queuosine precursor transporter [Prodigiosinella aquatilis]|nr:queuosine precursor transporter [Prodigiosinella sp. LS101]WJV55006.1 queuosine precursor transporter [Prodigiosinella sp. LS101]WJV59366.1 queuosine precursor transporter [Pectobacteriaceae bacterium C111]
MRSNRKFKLLGFNYRGGFSANIMVLATGETINMDLKKLADSEISEDLSRHELNALYKNLYRGKDITTTYAMSDRHDRSWHVYVLISIALTVILIFSIIAGVKPVYIPILKMIVPSAGFVYPITFILMDILNEFYGLKLARQTIIISFFFVFFFILALWITSLIPSLPQWEYGHTYNGIIHSMMVVLVASFLAYLVSENVNSYVLYKIKLLTKSKYLFIRVITSTVIASALDSIIFCTLAFYNVLSFEIIKEMILSQFLIKVVYAVLGVGPIYGAGKLFRSYINTFMENN